MEPWKCGIAGTFRGHRQRHPLCTITTSSAFFPSTVWDSKRGLGSASLCSGHRSLAFGDPDGALEVLD
jgi:hypothetical protein